MVILAGPMISRRLLLAAWLPMIMAGCFDSDRQSRFPTSPSAGPPAPAPPAPAPPTPGPVPPPVPGAGPPEDHVIPNSGDRDPSYTPGVGTLAVRSGEAVVSRVEASDLPCWVNWDLNGRCKVFEVIAPVDGTLTASARLTSPPSNDNLDLLVIDLGRAFVISYSGVSGEETSFPVAAGSSYGVAVMSYAVPADFQLRVDVVR